MEIYKEFRFEAAHFLPNVPKGHKCGNMHGHSYRVVLFVKGDFNTATGWVIDFVEIKNAFNPILTKLDHSLLNDFEGLENPTTESLAIWLWKKLYPELPALSKIEVSETCTSGCIYDGKS